MGAGTSGSSRGMQEVDLVEAHDARTGADPVGQPHSGALGLWRASATGAARAGRALWRHRRRWPLLAGMVVVLAVVWTGARVVQWRHEQAYLAGLVGVPGVLAPLDATATVRWTADIGELLGTMDWTEVGDLLIGTGADLAGPRIVAVDGATGEVRWRWPAQAPPSTTEPAGLSRPSCSATSVPVLVCWSGVVTGRTSTSLPADERQTVLVLDPTTGAELREPVELPAWSEFGTAGADVVLAVAAEDGDVRVGRYDPVTWSPRWSTTLAAPVGDGRGTDGDEQWDTQPSLVVHGARATVGSGVLGVVELTVTDGTLVATTPPTGDPLFFLQAFDGTPFVVWHGIGVVETATVDGLSSWSGFWTPPATDDGSLGLLLTRSGTLGSGNRLDLMRLPDGDGWSVDDVDFATVWVLDGRVVALVPGEAQAFDGADGDELWTSPVRRLTTGSGVEGQVATAALTDGRSLFVVALAMAESGYEGRVLQAYSLADGSPTWQLDLPDDTRQVYAVGGRLLAQTSGGLLVHLG
ncbi:hypothetical protein AGMMS50218_05860 [Actinomycetota bacterium]|nr:hypothetical protein AGMMS50218_05860 [Actinomycetota bacterium]